MHIAHIIVSEVKAKGLNKTRKTDGKRNTRKSKVETRDIKTRNPNTSSNNSANSRDRQILT